MPAPARAAAIPDLLVEAQRVVNTVMNGWHGRRKRGPGENFWQFRPYVEGESSPASTGGARPATTIPMSATANGNPPIRSGCGAIFRLRCSIARRWRRFPEARSLVLTLALAELLSRSGERIAFPELIQPFSARNGAERLAAALMHDAPAPALPDIGQIRRFSEVVLVSDFLHPFDELSDLLDRLARRGVRAHLVEVADPAEETFPIPAAPSSVIPKPARRLSPVGPKPMRRTIAASTPRGAKPSSITASGLAGAIRFTAPTGRQPKRWRVFTMP